MPYPLPPELARLALGAPRGSPWELNGMPHRSTPGPASLYLWATIRETARPVRACFVGSAPPSHLRLCEAVRPSLALSKQYGRQKNCRRLAM